MREIVLDTETTGLDPRSGHRIIEIGALEMVNKVVTGNKFHFYINPKRDVPNEAYKVHGISSEFLKDKPLFSDIVQDFIEFIEDGKLIIHNAPFDIKFLNHELNLVKKPLLNLTDAIDTLVMARSSFPGARVRLDDLCKRFKIDNSHRQFHGALKDAALLAEVYVELTGGRQETFSMSYKADKRKENSEIDANQKKGNGIIFQPTEEEKQKHSQFIKKFLNTT